MGAGPRYCQAPPPSRPAPGPCGTPKEGVGGAKLGQLSDSHGIVTISVWLPGGEVGMTGGWGGL